MLVGSVLYVVLRALRRLSVILPVANVTNQAIIAAGIPAKAPHDVHEGVGVWYREVLPFPGRRDDVPQQPLLERVGDGQQFLPDVVELGPADVQQVRLRDLISVLDVAVDVQAAVALVGPVVERGELRPVDPHERRELPVEVLLRRRASTSRLGIQHHVKKLFWREMISHLLALARLVEEDVVGHTHDLLWEWRRPERPGGVVPAALGLHQLGPEQISLPGAERGLA